MLLPPAGGSAYTPAMVYQALTSWQLALAITIKSLLLAGVLGLLAALWQALRPSRRQRAKTRATALTGAALLSVGIVCHLTLGGLALPRRVPLGLINTPTHFRSTAGPSIDLQAPAGWTLKYVEDPAKQLRQVQALKEAEGTVLVIETYDITDFVSIEHTASLAAATMGRMGLTQEGALLSATVAGRPARGSLMRRPDGVGLCSWVVHLHDSVVGNVQCLAPAGQDVQRACQAPLQALRWLS